MKFDLVEGDGAEETKKSATFQVGGNDISYFEEETNNGVQEEEEKIEDFKCDTCGKVFASAASLRGHKLSHTK